MLILRTGLYIAAVLALYTTWASSGAGYPVEAAMLRGLLVFMGSCFVAYLAELVVMTAPPAARRARRAEAQRGDGMEEHESVNRPARAGGETAADDRRAA